MINIIYVYYNLMSKVRWSGRNIAALDRSTHSATYLIQDNDPDSDVTSLPPIHTDKNM